MPFGKANSSKIFCRWTTAWCKAFSVRFHEQFGIPIILESYVDDFFGGPKKSRAGIKADKMNAKLMFENLISVGDLTGAKMNSKKCHPPARVMEILGFLYDAINRSCKLSEEKVQKYISRIRNILNEQYVYHKHLEKLVGNLTYAAWVSPFGRPFLSVLSTALGNSKKGQQLVVSAPMKNALKI